MQVPNFVNSSLNLQGKIINLKYRFYQIKFTINYNNPAPWCLGNDTMLQKGNDIPLYWGLRKSTH